MVLESTPSFTLLFSACWSFLGSSVCEHLKLVVNDFCYLYVKHIFFKYSNDPKFSDRKVWANSADPDQTAPRGAVLSGSSLFAIFFAPF